MLKRNNSRINNPHPKIHSEDILKGSSKNKLKMIYLHLKTFENTSQIFGGLEGKLKRGKLKEKFLNVNKMCRKQFTVVKHLLKRDENNKRTYQSDGHVIYKNMTGIITESVFVLTLVESINLELASPQ